MACYPRCQWKYLGINLKIDELSTPEVIDVAIVVNIFHINGHGVVVEEDPATN